MRKLTNKKCFEYCHIGYENFHLNNLGIPEFKYRIKISYNDSAEEYFIKWQIWSGELKIECETDNEVLRGYFELKEIFEFALNKSDEKFQLCINNINKRLRNEKTTD